MDNGQNNKIKRLKPRYIQHSSGIKSILMPEQQQKSHQKERRKMK